MEKETMKKLIAAALFLVFGGLIALFTLVDLNLGIVDFSSVKGIIAKREQLLELESKLEKTENSYNNSKKELVTAQNGFTTAKNKYEAISDETINLIKEATTKENYDIEYMWIRLGNYASSNNLEIILVEPGGKNVATTQNSTQQDNTQQNSQDSANKQEANSTTTTTTNSDTLMTVTLQGSYLNVSDFIFEVENDKELRFKLDNIEMTYVEGTTIKAKFDVKNITVLK